MGESVFGLPGISAGLLALRVSQRYPGVLIIPMRQVTVAAEIFDVTRWGHDVGRLTVTDLEICRVGGGKAAVLALFEGKLKSILASSEAVA